MAAPALFDAIAEAAAARVGEFSPFQLANLAWAFAKASVSDGKLFHALARSAEQRAGDFGASDLASIAWAFANATRALAWRSQWGRQGR